MQKNVLMKASLALCLLASVQAHAQIPVIPGASGFGINTPAGRGGQVLRVTNLNFDGKGSLKACIDATGPRVCVFEVSGSISLGGGNLNVNNPYLTIAGQTAPSPGIVLTDGSLRIDTSDVLVQHIAVRVGDKSVIKKPSNADASKIESSDGSARSVVLDHVSLSWAIDENLSSYSGAADVTVRYSIISEALHDSSHEKGPHSKGVLFSNSKGNFSMIGNLLAHNHARNPRVLTSGFVLANNVIYNYGNGATDLSIPSNGAAIHHSIVGNLYIEGPDTNSIKPISIRQYSDATSIRDSRIFLSNNHWANHQVSDQWGLVTLNLSFSPKVNSAPVWPSGLQAISALVGNGSDVLDMVLDNAGARPADRDAVDTRVVSDVRKRSGRIINCVAADGTSRCSKNAGGWPRYAQNRRDLTLPSNPNGDNDGDGYTNLEEWLHQMAVRVENGGAGADGNNKPQPPRIVSVN